MDRTHPMLSGACIGQQMSSVKQADRPPSPAPTPTALVQLGGRIAMCISRLRSMNDVLDGVLTRAVGTIEEVHANPQAIPACEGQIPQMHQAMEFLESELTRYSNILTRLETLV